MIDQAVLHERSRRQLEQTLRQPPHALLLHGVQGIGKQYIAQLAAGQLLALQAIDALQDYPYYHLVAKPADKSSIGIETVRDLLQFTKLKLPAGGVDDHRPVRRIILIADAHSLTTEAQNALLKLLEEPPDSTMFILTATGSQSLLPTIRSRVQSVGLLQPDQSDLTAYFIRKAYPPATVQQAYLMSGGLPGLMSALLQDDGHPLTSAVQTARKLLQSSQFERLCLVDDLAKKKTEAQQVLFVLQHMARAAITQAGMSTDPSADKRIRQWHKIMQAAYDAERSFSVSAQAKLALDNLMLSL